MRLHYVRRGSRSTRSAPLIEWGGRGLFNWWNGSFPPASEREARMDDPMIRSRLGRINGTRPLGVLVPKQEPPPFLPAVSR
jgi:hypothetical protein